MVAERLRELERLRLQAVDLLREVVDPLGQREQVLVLLVLLLDRPPTGASESTSRFASARFCEIITNVERKIASSETIIVSSPNGYFSTRKTIHTANQTMWT